MKIRIAARLFDVLGYIEFTPVSSNVEGSVTRRVNRQATLDGGAAFTDRGYTDADRTLVYRYRPVSEEHDDRARRLVELHPTVAVSNQEGLFEAAPQSFEPGPDENRLTLLVIQKLSEG